MGNVDIGVGIGIIYTTINECPPDAAIIDNYFSHSQKLLAKYGSLVSVVIIVVLFVYLVASPSSGAKGSKKKR